MMQNKLIYNRVQNVCHPKLNVGNNADIVLMSTSTQSIKYNYSSQTSRSNTYEKNYSGKTSRKVNVI